MFILRKIIKIVATRCHILKAIMHKIRFLLGSAADPAYSAPADRRAAGLYWDAREGQGRRKGREPTSKATGGREEGEGRVSPQT